MQKDSSINLVIYTTLMVIVWFVHLNHCDKTVPYLYLKIQTSML